MIVDVHSVPTEATSPKFAAAFAAGCGGRVVTDAQPSFGRAVALFGSPARWEFLQAHIQRGSTWFYGDHAYFGRHTFYRVTRDRYQHDGRGETDGKRFKSFGIPVEPWRKGGRDVVFCPPGAVFCGLMGFDRDDYVRETVATLEKYTDRPIIIREKPAGGRPDGLRDALKDAFAVVTHMSNVGVEAVLAGVPAFLTGKCAALTMGSDELSQIETPKRPNGRRQWAGVLADNQWTLDEIAHGECWRKIGVTEC